MENWWQTTFPNGRQTLTITDANGQNVSIAYGERGEGKPLILIHGWGGWSYSWCRNIVALSEQFRVICFDAKGHGFSEKPSTTETIGHEIVETANVIKVLCDQPVAIASESQGAIISLAVTETYPELISHLILIDAAIFPHRMPTWSMRLMVRVPIAVVRFLDWLRIMKIFAPLLRYLTKRNQREIYYNHDNITDEGIYGITYPYIAFRHAITSIVENSKLATRELEKLMKQQPNLISQIQEKLSTITQPTLILWGEHDQWFPVGDGEKLHSILPNSTFKIISQCGHHASGDCPEEINTAIQTFLKDTHYV